MMFFIVGFVFEVRRIDPCWKTGHRTPSYHHSVSSVVYLVVCSIKLFRLDSWR
jgi:hypothetical protein